MTSCSLPGQTVHCPEAPVDDRSEEPVQIASQWPAANKGCDGGEMWHAITGQGFENNIGFTAPLNLATGGDAFGIGK